MKWIPLLVVAVASAATCTDSPRAQKQPAPAEGITAPAPTASPATITSASITVSEAGKASTVCGVYLAEIDKAHATLKATPEDQEVARQVQVYATLATDACN